MLAGIPETHVFFRERNIAEKLVVCATMLSFSLNSTWIGSGPSFIREDLLGFKVRVAGSRKRFTREFITNTLSTTEKFRAPMRDMDAAPFSRSSKALYRIEYRKNDIFCP